jgi:hypothetical protein
LITDAVNVSGKCSNDDRTWAARTASARRSANVAVCTKSPAPQVNAIATVNDRERRVNKNDAMLPCYACFGPKRRLHHFKNRKLPLPRFNSDTMDA